MNKYNNEPKKEFPSVKEIYNRLKNADSLKIEQFGVLIEDTLNVLNLDNKTMSEEFGISVLTVQRWRTGRSLPNPINRRMVYEWLENLVKAKL